MLRTAHKIITGLIIALGSLHILFTFHDYDSFSLRAVWFASAGVAIILAGFLNIVLLRDTGKDKVVWMLCLFANIIFAVMFSTVLALMQQPQVFFGVILFVAATITAFKMPKASYIKF
jgi:fatty acid desaturase